MTTDEKIAIAADMLYDAYGDKATERLAGKVDWSSQPEGWMFWADVNIRLWDMKMTNEGFGGL